MTNKAIEGKEPKGMGADYVAEVAAIETVLGALGPLDSEARTSVLEYVTKRLQIALPGSHQKLHPPLSLFPPPPAAETPSHGTAGTALPVHIKQFKEEKKPRSANEMAALVAYYLANLAADRKDTIGTKDIETQFKIADFPLPEQPRLTLLNAKAAGYFDSADRGEYRLNAVGYNLVAHSMPRGSGERRKRRKGAKNGKTRRKR